MRQSGAITLTPLEIILGRFFQPGAGWVITIQSCQENIPILWRKGDYLVFSQNFLGPQREYTA